MFALNNELRVREGIVIADMVDIEMGADQQVDVIGVQAEIGEMLDHILFSLGRSHPR